MESGVFSGQTVRSRRTLYTAGAFAKENLIYLQEAGELTAVQQHTSRRQRLESYLFFIVLEGKGRLEYEGRSYELHKNSCVFIDCRKRYSHQPDENDLWRLKWAHFSGRSMEAIYREYLSGGGQIVFETAHPASYASLLERVISAAKRSVTAAELEICGALTALIADLFDQKEQSLCRLSPVSAMEQVEEVRRYLRENYCEKLTLPMAAEQFHMNKYYLTRVFRQETGVTVMTYLTLCRITEAKKLLRFSALPIASIAHACGFEDAGYFSRVFRACEKQSPGEFRKLWTKS